MLNTKTILSFSEAARSFPAIDGHKPHPSTIWRWARKGISGVKLETRRCGGRFVTSKEALERFTAALAEIPPQPRNHTPKPEKTPAKPRSAKQRQRAIQKAATFLEERGV